MNNSIIYTGSKTLENMNQAKFYNRWTLGKFNKYLTGDILEVGCGIGSFTRFLFQYGKVFAIDIDRGLVKIMKTGNLPGVIGGYGDIEKGRYFFKNRTFDTIVCLNVLEHIKNDKEALQNIYNLLNQDGRLILLVPIHKFLYGSIDEYISHYRRYDPTYLKATLEQIGFKVDESKKMNWLGAIGWLIAGRILKEKNVESRNIKIFNLFAPLALWIENLIEPPIGTSVLIIAKKV